MVTSVSLYWPVASTRSPAAGGVNGGVYLSSARDGLVGRTRHDRSEGWRRVLSRPLRLGRVRGADRSERDVFDVPAARQGSRGCLLDASGRASARRAVALEPLCHG